MTNGYSKTYEKCEFDLSMIKGNTATSSVPFISHISKDEFNYFSVSFTASQSVQNPLGLLEFHDKTGKWPIDLKYISNKHVPCKCDS